MPAWLPSRRELPGLALVAVSLTLVGSATPQATQRRTLIRLPRSFAEPMARMTSSTESVGIPTTGVSAGPARHSIPARWCRRPQLSHNAQVNSRVHPKYKTRYRVGNWPAYERGDVTLWLSPDAVAAWTPGLSGRPGGPRKFSDHAIETALTLRLVFRLPLRQTEGFLRSVLTLMATGLDAPDHTTLSRRGQPLDVALARMPTHGPVDLVVDSTGLSVFGEGEWAAAKHGGRG